MSASASKKRKATGLYADAALAVLVLLIVGMMIVPLPTFLLDMLITANISFGVLMVLVALYMQDGLAFTSFPTLLLVTTLFRLALNVSSTRLILLQGNAGEVITAFGNFVVKGNYAVGGVVFLILTLIQFLVIAKGSERVAEVAARFTLDAMPGKQMAIDAELRTGAIGQDEARRRRRALARESQFYGAMDGAMKFVKGDAIAGIVITVINLIGGLVIGVMMRGMTAGNSLKLYGLLTIGDGLVSQIPSLLISTAAGLVVTRVASETEESSLGLEVGTQIFGNPKALTVAAVFLLVLVLVPGLPKVPFLVLAICLGLLARNGRRKVNVQEISSQAPAGEAARKTSVVTQVTPVTLDLSAYAVERLIKNKRLEPLEEESLPALRNEIALQLGIPVPVIRLRVVATLNDGDVQVSVHEVPVVKKQMEPDSVLVRGLVFDEGALNALPPEVDRTLCQPRVDLGGWTMPMSHRASLEQSGFVVVDEIELGMQALVEAIRLRAADLIGLQETQSLLDAFERTHPALVKNVVPKPVPLPLMADVLKRLVEEGISIRPMREILEALAVYGPGEKDPVALTEFVRAGMRRQITHRFAHEGVLSVYVLDPFLEDTVREAIQRTATGTYLALPPSVSNDLLQSIKKQIGSGTAVLVTQSDVRRFVRRLVELELPDLVVLGYQELDPQVTVQHIARITP